MDVNFDKNNINYSFDDYRKEIRTILERNNKRIKISEVLKECGISKGNYYVFMKGGRKYKNGVVSTLSYEKLDRLLEKLREMDAFPTNRKKLASMTNEQLARFIVDEIIKKPNVNYVDVLKWLKSTDSKTNYTNKSGAKHEQRIN